MSREICFATNNENKLKEVNALVGSEIKILGLKDIGCNEELAEDGHTLEENSLQKAQYVSNKYHIPCFADDTGLEVDALGGEPGVYSARYAGPERDNHANMQLLLKKLCNKESRKARFRTVITYVASGEVLQFEGIVDGEIIKEFRGKKGFGYDPIFQPENHSLTFAEMGMKQKNKISHRARAFTKFLDFLSQK